RVIFGEMTNAKLATISDLEWREAVIFAPLILATLYLGLHPDWVFQLTGSSVDALVAAYQGVGGA
ncbi:MAG TPA: NADH-quinone oxidoreductase subunit M, partial [Caulobacteraceae bacterium]